MTRVRLALLVLAVAIALPVGALVLRALDSVEAERQLRHQAVADRTFDEMERALSVWLEREESRPFADYRFYPMHSLADGPTPRSALSRLPQEAFVIGAFQIDPDGSLHTPLEPREPSLATARGDWPPAEDVRERIRRVRELAAIVPEHARRLRALGTTLDRHEREKKDNVRPTGSMLGDRPSLGGESTGQSAAKIAEGKKATALVLAESPAGRGAKEEQGKDQEKYSAYDVLESLNLASSQRAGRRQKVRLEKRSELPVAPTAGFSSMADEVALEPAAPMPARSILADEEDALDLVDSSETVRIAIDPMTGIALESTEPTLALYRSVIVEAQGYRQGLLVDLAELGEMLEMEVVRAGGLGNLVRIDFGPSGTLAPTASGEGVYSYVHRFAEPFDALSARLSLEPLSGPPAEERTLFVLVGLIVLLTLGGLYVVDRMTRVVIDFAERRSNFVAAVSHELKTPLTAIRMYAEMLRDGLVRSDEKRAEYYATITDESERLTRLIDNVLEFSRLEKGRRELALVVGDPAGPVLEAVEHLKPHAEREGFELLVEVDDALPPVVFEPDALVQVVFNLVDNAIKYATTATRREIVLRLHRRDDGVELSVRDFGPGVAAADLRRVFAPFYRVESELTRSAKGTGIGLALVSGLAAAMRAKVVAENPAEGGFCVRLILTPG